MVNWYAWPVALGGAVAVTYFVYGKQQWKSIKALFRFSGTFLVLFLLFNPSWIFEKTNQRKPVYFIFTDVSESAKSESLKASEKLKLRLRADVGEDIQLREFYFGSELSTSSNDSIAFATRIDKVTEFISQESNQPEASFLISDGISNRGGSPLVSSMKSPIFSLGIGDPKFYPDVSVVTVSSNESVFKGNDFDVEATIHTELLAGKPVVVDFYQNGQIRDSRTLKSERNIEFHRITFTGKGEKEGFNEILVKVRNSNIQEKNINNNVQKGLIEVVAKRKTIAFLYQFVHPDLGAIRSALMGVPQYEIVECANISDLPVNPHLVIAFKLRSEVFRDLNSRGIPYWLFTDEPSQLNPEISITNRSNQFKNQVVTPEVNAGFESFSIEPLPFAFKSVDCPLLKLNVPREKIQLFQQWNRVNTNLPLCFCDDLEVRKLYFAGFGIWKWRINELKQRNESRWFDQWVRSNVEWLSNQTMKTKHIEWNLNKRNWIIGEQRKFRFSLFDGASKKVENASVSCFTSDPKGNKQNLALASNLGVFNGVFRPTMGGNHVLTIQLKSPINGVKEREFKQVFQVDTISLEAQTLKANHQLLMDISQKSNAAFYSAENNGLDSILNQIKLRELNKPRFEIINSRVFAKNQALFLILIVVFFGVEWFLRKWEGKI